MFLAANIVESSSNFCINTPPLSASPQLDRIALD
jgi:hypothetical protein